MKKYNYTKKYNIGDRIILKNIHHIGSFLFQTWKQKSIGTIETLEYNIFMVGDREAAYYDVGIRFDRFLNHTLRQYDTAYMVSDHNIKRVIENNMNHLPKVA